VFGPTDCGPASVAMAINYATGKSLKPLEVRKAIAKLPGAGYAANPNSGTAIGDLARIARANGVEVFMGDGAASVGWGPERIRKHLGEGHTVIVLTRLAQLPGYSPTSQVDHYILLTGANATGYSYNDPGQGNGANRTIGERQLQLAQRSTSVPGQGIALAGPNGGAKGAAAAAPPQPTFSVTVAKGDTLSQLAEKFAVSQKDIVALNGLPNPHRIQVGQVLKLPGEEPKPAPTPEPSPTAQPRPAPAPKPKASSTQLKVRAE
jgi:LysM repeat protein